MHLEKNRSYACTFPVQRREINVVKVRFTMRYSSRKLSNDKVITTACNFWRQIACSFQVMSGNILFLGKKYLKSRHFFWIWAKKKFTHAHYVFPPWTCNASSTKILLDFILDFRPHSFDSVTLSCARKKGTAGVENDSLFAESFSSTTKSNKRKKCSARRVLFQVKNSQQFATSWKR